MRAYYMRLKASDPGAARSLLEALEQVGSAVAHRREHEILLLWPASEVDDPQEWDEQTFTELVFFLRAWSGADPQRSLTVLEERPIDVPEEIFQLAS